MKWYRIDESVDGGKDFDIRKVLRANGIRRIPSRAYATEDRIEFSRRGGYSGERTVDAMLDQVLDAGWTELGAKRGGMSPDGSAAGRGSCYVSPDGQLKFSCSKYYGSTSYDNFFGFTFKRI